jgi:hypothetical protein
MDRKFSGGSNPRSVTANSRKRPGSTHCDRSERRAKIDLMTSSTVSFAGCTFAADKGCFTCQHFVDGAPVLLFTHEADGDLQFMCGASGQDFDKDCRWLHMTHLLESAFTHCRPTQVSSASNSCVPLSFLPTQHFADVGNGSLAQKATWSGPLSINAAWTDR